MIYYLTTFNSIIMYSKTISVKVFKGFKNYEVSLAIMVTFPPV